jgi:hypothetical protein
MIVVVSSVATSLVGVAGEWWNTLAYNLLFLLWVELALIDCLRCTRRLRELVSSGQCNSVHSIYISNCCLRKRFSWFQRFDCCKRSLDISHIGSVGVILVLWCSAIVARLRSLCARTRYRSPWARALLRAAATFSHHRYLTSHVSLRHS